MYLKSIFSGNEGFIVNLTSGPNVELDEEETGQLDDRLLALRVDLAKGKVFLNACINGQWGKYVLEVQLKIWHLLNFSRNFKQWQNIKI